MGKCDASGCHKNAGEVDVASWNRSLADMRIPRHSTSGGSSLPANSSFEVQHYIGTKVSVFKNRVESLRLHQQQKAFDAYFNETSELIWVEQKLNVLSLKIKKKSFVIEFLLNLKKDLIISLIKSITFIKRLFFSLIIKNIHWASVLQAPSRLTQIYLEIQIPHA